MGLAVVRTDVETAIRAVGSGAPGVPTLPLEDTNPHRDVHGGVPRNASTGPEASFARTFQEEMGAARLQV